jgi:ankyrin repeat protein
VALAWAASRGNEEAVQFLLAHGADFAATDGNGFTPAMEAKRFGNPQCLRLLEVRGGISSDDWRSL